MAYLHLFVVLLCVLYIRQTDSRETNNFICTDGTVIDLKNICNGVADCPDRSDEIKELCYHIICPKGMFRCYYGACIDRMYRCNNKYDCLDKSDESQCGRINNSCDANEFKCVSGECILSDTLCDGIGHCQDGSDESETMCVEPTCPVGSFHCKYGGCIHKDSRCDGQADCIDGSDESDILCIHLRNANKTYNTDLLSCPAIDLSRIDAICETKTGILPCDKYIPVGTHTKYECKPFFVPINQKHVQNKHATCQLDGTWSKEPLKCEPDCGSMEPDAVALIVNGWDTNRKIYPWHAILYIHEGDDWDFWCGGTLITEKLIVTAAHCTWQIVPEQLKIKVGKYYTDFNKTETHVTQMHDVREIINQPLYQDRSGNYGSDLAVIVLKEAVKLSTRVKPACLDWDHRDYKYHLRKKSIGLVVGMGITENETLSATLRGVYLPVETNERCVQEQSRDFKKFITYTVFCAGWRNGTGVCNGDSGSGFMFPKRNDKSRWVLQGVVSVSPRRHGTSFCDPHFYTVFTKVDIYLSWLKELVDRIQMI